MTIDEMAEMLLMVTKNRFEGQDPHSVFMAAHKLAHMLANDAGLASFKTSIRYPRPKRGQKR